MPDVAPRLLRVEQPHLHRRRLLSAFAPGLAAFACAYITPARRWALDSQRITPSVQADIVFRMIP